MRARGELRVVRGPRRAARVLAMLMRLPKTHPATDTRLVVTTRDGEQHWQRTFGNRHLDSRQYATGEHEVGERIGWLEFRFRLEVRDGSLVFRQVALAIMLGSVRVRVPAAWGARVDAKEDPGGPRHVAVAVRVAMPIVGTVLSYDGVIHVEEHRS